jgi:3-dehydroquinate synthase class II
MLTESEVYDRTIIGTPNQRRANRIRWSRPVRIISPQPAAGETMDISACGVLVRLDERKSLKCGETVAIEIPRLDGSATALRTGRVVRVEPAGSGMAVAIDLL